MDTKRRKIKIPGEIFVVLGIVAVLAVAIFAAIKHDRIVRAEVDGTYSCTYASKSTDGSESSITVSITFDSQSGTFQEMWNTSVFATGTYTVEGKKVLVTVAASGDHGSETMEYTVEGDVLIPLDYIYEGKVPSGDRFDAHFSLEDGAGEKTNVEFKKDGTFEIKTVSSTTSSNVKGTYERKGDYIYRTREDGSPLTSYYIFGKQLVGAFYEKSDETINITGTEIKE